jgi:hypothetical protein
MTLILALINADQALQLSDRRLTYRDARAPEDESDKAIYYKTDNARLAVGYTGLAAAGRFRTHRWLVEQLGPLSEPEHNAGVALERLRESLTETFTRHPSLRRLAASEKRLTVMFTGYLDAADPPRGGSAVLTNFQDPMAGTDAPEAWDEFQLVVREAVLPRDGESSFVLPIGAWRAVKREDVEGLRRLLEERRPQQAILARAIHVIRAIGDRPEAGGSVGRSLSSITIPREAGGPTMAFHAGTSMRLIPAPATVISTSGVQVGFREFAVRRADPELVPPEGTPLPGRNDPCWCGSGVKYKRCHGR